MILSSLWSLTLRKNKLCISCQVYLATRIDLPYKCLKKKSSSYHSACTFLCQTFLVHCISQVKQNLLETEGVYTCLLNTKVLVDAMPDEIKDDQPTTLGREIKTLFFES